MQIHLHGKSLESLHKYIPKEALPSEYGGTQGPFDNSSWKREILNDREYFERLEELQRLSEVDEDDSSSLGSPGQTSLNGKLAFIDGETEDSEASEENLFFNCDSPDSDQKTSLYLRNDICKNNNCESSSNALDKEGNGKW